MKIGILTFQFAHNYGAMLQCYALKSTLEKMNLDVDVINYRPKEMTDFYSLNPIVIIKRHDLKALLGLFSRKNQAFKFYDFQVKELNIGRKIDHINDNTIGNYEVVVVGSDQVWNSNIVPDIGEYLLSGCTKCKKYSYAASLGKKEISESMLLSFQENLFQYSGISIREKNNAEYLSEMLCVDILNTVDPVFLLTQEEWRSFYLSSNPPKLNHNKYLLYIDLFDSKELMKKAKDIAHRYNLTIITVDPMCRNNFNEVINLHNVGPFEYLQLIDHACFIVTNSFHAVSFSYIFEKKMAYYLKNELSNRITELLKNINVKMEEIIDFKQSDRNYYEELIKKSKKYLQTINKKS